MGSDNDRFMDKILRLELLTLAVPVVMAALEWRNWALITFTVWFTCFFSFFGLFWMVGVVRRYRKLRGGLRFHRLMMADGAFTSDYPPVPFIVMVMGLLGIIGLLGYIFK